MATAAQASIAELATPLEWSRFHGVSISSTYRLIRSGRLDALNISGGERATWRLPIEALPTQPSTRETPAQQDRPSE